MPTYHEIAYGLRAIYSASYKVYTSDTRQAQDFAIVHPSLHNRQAIEG